MELVALSTSLLLVNLLFAAIALGVGFAAGAWFGGAGDSQRPNTDSASSGSDASSDEEQLERERTVLASDRLRDLAAHVASDVGAHNASIEQIETDLAASRGADSEAVAAAASRAIEQISAANTDLQQKLAKAEQQIEAQAEEIRAHECEARTDSLTQLANRRAFDDELKRRLAELQRHQTTVSLLILDVDHFKKFNDTHGHQAGDEVLRRVGATLIECARESDLPCRYGGEEFAIVLPATTGDDSGVVAERVRKSIEGLQIDFEGKKLSVTVSIGLAEAEFDEQPATLIRRADDALYQSKDAGRNNAHLHNGRVCVPITPGMAKPAQAAPTEAPSEAGLVSDAIANRTRFLEELRQRGREAEDAKTPLALLGAELDGQARLRTEFGDEIAQLTVDSVGQFIEHALTERDFIGSLGDGRFVVLLPGRDADRAGEFGERVRSALAGCSVPLGDEQLQLNTRMSVAAWQKGDTEVTIMRRMETAMDLLSASNGETTLV